MDNDDDDLMMPSTRCLNFPTEWKMLFTVVYGRYSQSLSKQNRRIPIFTIWKID